MAAIQNDMDVLLQAAAVRKETVALPSNTTIDFGQVNGSTKPSNNADVSTTVLAASGTAIVMTSSALFKTTTGLGGVFIGAGGLIGRTTSGAQTFAINATTGAASFSGTISGAANINITGQAKFDGQSTSPDGVAAVVANESKNSVLGLVAYAGSSLPAVWGICSSNGPGVRGTSTSGEGVSGETSAASGHAGVFGDSSGAGSPGGWFNHSTGGIALKASGKVEVGNFSITWNSLTMAAPTGSTTTVLHNDGVWRDPVTAARVNAAFGVAATGVTQFIVTDSGTATASGSGLNFNCTITGYTVVGSGNTMTLQPVSDARLKSDVQPEQLGLAFIQRLRPITYRMTSRPERRHHGFIAQDVEQLIGIADDALRSESPQGVKGVDYLSLIAPLVLAVQQLAAEVQQLKAGKP